MKAIYDWVPWFRELVTKIAEVGEKGLITRARSVKWAGTKPPELVRGKDDWIDPFSFLYTLASKNTKNQRPIVYPSVHSKFELEKRLPEPISDDNLYIFPSPKRGSVLFHSKTSAHFERLWQLFRSVVAGEEEVDGTTYRAVLKIKGVQEKRFTHVLFLIDPSRFLPTDSIAKLHDTPYSVTLPSTRTFRDYETACQRVSRSFDGQALYAVNRALFLHGRNGVDELISSARPQPQIQHPLNQIFYGPPGTGKTWSTLASAVAIVHGRSVEAIEAEGRESTKRRFDELRLGGQVATVTFHQNYAYEDFIEGIRPLVSRDSADKMSYELKKGLFRTMSDQAVKMRLRSDQVGKSWEAPSVVGMFLEWVQSETAGGRSIPLYRHEGVDLAIVGVYGGEKDAARGVQIRGSATQNLYRGVLERDYPGFRDGAISSYKDIKPVKDSTSDEFGQAVYAFEVLKKVREHHENAMKAENNARCVLIIDEINRGNIARIFGELITLVEESRRLGGSDETKVTLPYSGDEFGVPENLYIIGTMNTADRSIALLDTALRRRFEFVEMMPDSSLVDREVGGVNLRGLLDAINDRVRFLLDREHQIGHTYFLGVKDLESLKEVFQKQIVPLLQEYFYDDWAKIDAVLGWNGFVTTLKCPDELKGKDLVDDDLDAYEVLPFDDSEWRSAAAYRKIYGGEGDDGTAGVDREQPEGAAEADSG